MSEPVLRNRAGSTLHLTLHRPKRRNAMNLPMVRALLDAFADVESDGAIRAVVLRGAGGHFCAGGDVTEMAGTLGQPVTEDGDPLAALNRQFGALLQAVEALQDALCPLRRVIIAAHVWHHRRGARG